MAGRRHSRGRACRYVREEEEVEGEEAWCGLDGVCEEARAVWPLVDTADAWLSKWMWV